MLQSQLIEILQILAEINDLPSKCPVSQVWLHFLNLHRRKFEILYRNLLKRFVLKKLLEDFLSPLFVFPTGRGVPSIEAVELYRMSREYNSVRSVLPRRCTHCPSLARKGSDRPCGFPTKYLDITRHGHETTQTSKGVKLQLLPSLTRPRIEEK